MKIPDTRNMRLPEAAARWAVDWHVIMNRDKRPCHAIKGVQRPSPETVKNAFSFEYEAMLAMGISPEFARLLNPRSGVQIAIALPPNICVIDIDHRPEQNWDAKQIAQTTAKRFNLPKTAVVRSPSGGFHLWFLLPDGFRTRNWTSQSGRFPLQGIDIRTIGGNITVPPTTTSKGAYTWARYMERPAMASPALLEALTPPPEPEVIPGERQDFSEARCTKYVEAAYRDEIAAVACCGKGGRNAQLFKSAAALGSFVAAGALPRGHVEQSLIQAATQCKLVAEDGHHAARTTIKSGLDAGQKSPRNLDAGNRQYG